MALVMAQDGLYLRPLAICVESWWMCPADKFYDVARQKQQDWLAQKLGGLKLEPLLTS